MADLNPAIADEAARERFAAVLERAAPDQLESGRAQGDAYFHIPALERHRGIIHFYLESYSSGDFDADLALAQRFGEAVIDAYIFEVDHALGAAGEPTKEELRTQLEYHSVYFLQVLTLDRGTTSGLLVHDQNDVGILGSLPAYVDRELLESWSGLLPEPQDQLLRGLVAVLPEGKPSHVDDAARARLASVVRAHYRAHPDAIELQASGGIVPPTVANHQPAESAS